MDHMFGSGMDVSEVVLLSVMIWREYCFELHGPRIPRHDCIIWSQTGLFNNACPSADETLRHSRV